MSFNFRPSFTKLPKHRKFHYVPRYYDADKEERGNRGSLKLERGAFFKASKSPITNSLRGEHEYALRDRQKRRHRYFKLAFTFGILIWTYFLILGKINIIGGVLVLLILLVLYIRMINRP